MTVLVGLAKKYIYFHFVKNSVQCHSCQFTEFVQCNALLSFISQGNINKIIHFKFKIVFYNIHAFFSFIWLIWFNSFSRYAFYCIWSMSVSLGSFVFSAFCCCNILLNRDLVWSLFMNLCGLKNLLPSECHIVPIIRTTL